MEVRDTRCDEEHIKHFEEKVVETISESELLQLFILMKLELIQFLSEKEAGEILVK